MVYVLDFYFCFTYWFQSYITIYKNSVRIFCSPTFRRSPDQNIIGSNRNEKIQSNQLCNHRIVSYQYSEFKQESNHKQTTKMTTILVTLIFATCTFADGQFAGHVSTSFVQLASGKGRRGRGKKTKERPLCKMSKKSNNLFNIPPIIDLNLLLEISLCFEI